MGCTDLWDSKFTVFSDIIFEEAKAKVRGSQCCNSWPLSFCFVFFFGFVFWDMWFPATVLAHWLLILRNSVYNIWQLCSLLYSVCVSLGGENFLLANRKPEAQAGSGEFWVRSPASLKWRLESTTSPLPTRLPCLWGMLSRRACVLIFFPTRRGRGTSRGGHCCPAGTPVPWALG